MYLRMTSKNDNKLNIPEFRYLPLTKSEQKKL